MLRGALLTTSNPSIIQLGSSDAARKIDIGIDHKTFLLNQGAGRQLVFQKFRGFDLSSRAPR